MTSTDEQAKTDEHAKKAARPRQATHRDLIVLPVAEVMSRPVFAVTTDVVLGDVLTTMVRTGLRHLAVVDGGERCVGVVGDRAVAAAWASDPSALARMAVGHILDSRPSIVGADATLGDVARAMYLDGVDAVAVIDRTGRPVGMVTGGDLVTLMARQVPQSVTAPYVTPPDGTPPDGSAAAAA